MYKVSVIIVSYNSMRWIEKCLDNLYASTIQLSIIIVDNNSSDETVAFIHKNYPYVHVIENQYNVGFGKANNQGIEYAYSVDGAEYFFLCNQDVYVEPDTIETLASLQAKENISVISPIHFDGEKKHLDRSFASHMFKSVSYFDFIFGCLTNGLKSLYPVEFVNAAAWMINRDTIENIGGFDPIFPHYGEDANYLQRLLYHHKKVAVTPLAHICHDRKEKGNLTVFNKNSSLSALLVQYANPNKKMFDDFGLKLATHLVALRDMCKALLLGDFSLFKSLFKNYLYFFKNIRSIIDNKKQNKLTGCNWLALDKFQGNYSGTPDLTIN